MSRTIGLCIGIGIALAAATGCETIGAPDADGPGANAQCNLAEYQEVYDRYVGDIIADPASQSCTGCHPASVNLNMWVMGSPCQTMACMIEKELVDLDDPENSRIIGFIGMAQPDAGTDMAVQREYDGFMEWVDYMSACGLDACGEMADPCNAASTPPSTGSGGTTNPTGGGSTETMIGSCTEADVLEQFTSLIWTPLSSEQGCAACHAPAADDPKFSDAARWVHPGDPLTSLWDVIGTTNMLNATAVNFSELITKPLHQGQVTHATAGTFVGVTHDGGQKLTPAGPGFPQKFDNLVAFLEYYAGCVN